jgi:predicted glycosyltransferase
VDSQLLLRELAKRATIVCLPRYEEERDQLKEIPNVWVSPKPVLTAQLIPYVDLMVGSGGTACRETAFCGIPTINFQFWDVQARYLYKKGFPIQIKRNDQSIVRAAEKILRTPEKFKVNTQAMLSKLDSPLPWWTRYIELCMKQKM